MYEIHEFGGTYTILVLSSLHFSLFFSHSSSVPLGSGSMEQAACSCLCPEGSVKVDQIVGDDDCGALDPDRDDPSW